MNNHSSQFVEDILVWAKTVTVDLPLATTQWAAGVGTEETATTMAWRGYDASVRLLTAGVDTLYQAPLVGYVFDQTATAALRWHQLSNAVTGLVFAGLRQTIDLPTTSALHELQATMTQLAAEVHDQRDRQEGFFQLLISPPRATTITEQRHVPKFRSRRHASPPHRLSLAVKRLAQGH